MKRTTYFLAAVAVLTALGSGHDAQADFGDAETTVPCCQLTTSLARAALRGQDLPGDERFFKGEAAPPNIHFVLDTSGSMRELPQVPSGDDEIFFNSDPDSSVVPMGPNAGCSNTYLVNHQTARGWNPATETGGSAPYPIPDPGTGIGSDNGFPNLFVSGKIYSYLSWGDSSSPTAAYVDKSSACKAIWPGWAGGEAPDYTQCMSCLNSKGFYKKIGVTWGGGVNKNFFVFTGNYLNFNPPKYVSARAVLKRVVADLRRVRMGLTSFDSSDDGGDLQKQQNPPCNLSLSEGSSYDSNRSSIISEVNSLNFNSNTPLGETLFNVGQYFCSENKVYTNSASGNPPGFGFSSSYIKSSFSNGSLTGQQRSFCWGCQVSSAIIITDGEPTKDSNLPRTRIQAINGGAVTCPDYDGDTVGDCKWLEDAARNDLLDDVAKLLYTQDLQRTNPPIIKSNGFNTAGEQVLVTYGVGFGHSAAILRSAAEVGGGAYYEAYDRQELQDRILEAVSQIQTRATSFAAASVSSLQVNRTGGAILPRFRPARLSSRPWEGFLYRFELGSERVTRFGSPPAFCDDAKAATILSGGAGDPNDLNFDGDCDDINLIDSQNHAVVEDDDGNFKKFHDPTVPAVEYWEASKVLKPNPLTLTENWRNRKIYTIIDDNGDGRIDKNDTPLEFDESNANRLRQYLGISNAPTECPELAAALGYASLTPDECATWIIRYWRGADVLSGDPSRQLKDRPNLLMDIFHGSPIPVDPPSPKYFCGFTNQCTQTLFGSTTTPMANYGLAPNQVDAYEKYREMVGRRDKIVIVGSNGGMLHAFHNGSFLEVDEVTETDVYDQGTGEELWAFVPPDQLTKMRYFMGEHSYFVDGTPMVREAWLDGVGRVGDAMGGDFKKQWSEYRTVAVVGQGLGGVHRFALDLTELIPGGHSPTRSVILTTPSGIQYSPPSEPGDFLWMWPQPCDALALSMGDSYGEFAPKPPPIGAVAIENLSGPIEVDGVKAEERWVVMLNGGADQYMSRGRGLFMVDVNSGSTIWSFTFNDGSPNSSNLRYPVAATPSMLDLGNLTGPTLTQDLLFDTAMVGDYGGQIWTVRFWKPGQISGMTGKVTNWYAARAFQIQASSSLRVREPFSYMVTNVLQPDTGHIRTFIGSGDRFNLIDTGGAHCRISDPYGCARAGCTARATVTIDRGGVTAETDQAVYTNYQYSSSSNTSSAAGFACQHARIRLDWDYDSANGCTNAEAGALEYVCDTATDAGTWNCRENVNDWVQVNTTNSTPPTSSPARFFGFWSYGVNLKRTFNTAAEADVYDHGYFGAGTRPMNDSDLVNATTTAASNSGNGWYLPYGFVNERTGSGSTTLKGCTLWNSFETQLTGTTICSTTGTNVGRYYQAHYVTGQPSCSQAHRIVGTGTRDDGGTYLETANGDIAGGDFYGSDGGTQYARFSEHPNTVSVPPDPIPNYTVAGGMAIVSTISSEPNRTSGNTIYQNADLVQTMYQMEVSREQHECRHEGLQCR